jgi:hypothetical protein
LLNTVWSCLTQISKSNLLHQLIHKIASIPIYNQRGDGKKTQPNKNKHQKLNQIKIRDNTKAKWHEWILYLMRVQSQVMHGFLLRGDIIGSHCQTIHFLLLVYFFCIFYWICATVFLVAATNYTVKVLVLLIDDSS